MRSHRGGGRCSHRGRSLPGAAPHALPSRVSMAGLDCSPGCHRRPQPHAAGRGCLRSRAGGDARLHLPAASHHPPAAGSWDAPRDLLRLGGRGVFLDSCDQAKSTGEAPDWPLPFPAQHGQEHELLLRCRGETELESLAQPVPTLRGPEHPQNQHRAVCVPGATKQKLFLYGLF